MPQNIRRNRPERNQAFRFMRRSSKVKLTSLILIINRSYKIDNAKILLAKAVRLRQNLCQYLSQLFNQSQLLKLKGDLWMRRKYVILGGLVNLP